MLLVQWAQQTEHCQSHPVWKIQDTEISVSLLTIYQQQRILSKYIVYSLARCRDQTEDCFSSFNLCQPLSTFATLIRLKLLNNTSCRCVANGKL